MGQSVHEKYKERRSTFRSGDRAQKRAVFVGINYENDIELKLNGCINDVHNAQKYLKNAGFVPDEVRVLTDNTHDDLPTRSNIIDAMQWLVDGSAPGDVLWFHFSGHGEQVKDGSGDEVDGKDEAIVPLDARSTRSLIADDVIHNCLVRDLPKGVTLYTVFDCCHSGTIMDLPFVYDETQSRFIRDRNYANESIDGRVVMISGCLNEQKSADLGENLFKGIKKSVGALSRALYKKLGNGYSWGALIAEVRVGLRSSKLSQVPQLESSREFDSNELAFGRAFGKGGEEGQGTSVPPPSDASEMPIHVLEIYEEKGVKVKGMDKYLAFARQKRKAFSSIFSKKIRGAKSYFGRGKSSRSGSKSSSASTDDRRDRRAGKGSSSSRRGRSKRDYYSSESYSDYYSY